MSLNIPSLAQSPYLLKVDGALRSFKDVFQTAASDIAGQSPMTAETKTRADAVLGNSYFPFITQPLPQASLEALAAKYDLEMPDDCLPVETNLALRG